MSKVDKCRWVIVCFAFWLSSFPALAQFADSVVNVNFGINYNIGYGPDNPNFPSCVLGRPDKSAGPCAPAFSPTEILSLGSGGSITVYFRRPIIDLPGVDFTVFENPFYLGCDTTRVFAETAIVSISKDGIQFFEFPFQVIDSLPINSPLRYRGLAGVTPTNGAANPLLPGSPNEQRSGGDSFDLAQVSLDTVYFVKITDAGERVNDGGIIADSFDLDAVVAIHQAMLSTRISTPKDLNFSLSQNFPNPFNPSTTIGFQLLRASSVRLELFDVLGQKVALLLDHPFQAGQFSFNLNTAPLSLTSGTYFYRLTTNEGSITKSMLLLK